MQEAFLMGQDKEVQRMLIKEKYDQMDWLSYGHEQREEEKKETAKRMIALGKNTLEEIAMVTGLKLSVVEELAGVVTA